MNNRLAATAQALARLSAFEGDSAASFRLLSTLCAELLPGAVQAYVLLRPSPRLAALRAADGQMLRELDDPLDHAGRLPRLDDWLTQHLCSECTPAWIQPSQLERQTLLGQWLERPQWVLRLPVYRGGEALHLALFALAEPVADPAALSERLLLLLNAGIAMVSGRIRERALARKGEQVLAEVRDLVDVQRALLPDNPQFQGVLHAVHYQPSAWAGGDYYDLMALGEGRVGALIADVSGHGAGAAMEAVQFDAILRTYQGNGPDTGPADALSYANRYFFSRRPRGHFMTALAILLDPAAGALRYCSAGHLPFLRWRAGQVERLGERGDPPLGILRDYTFTGHSLELQPGDVLLLYTDGIVEARDGQGREFGLQAVCELLAAHACNTPEALCAAVMTAVHQHQQSEVGRDDQTLLVLVIEPRG